MYVRFDLQRDSVVDTSYRLFRYSYFTDKASTIKNTQEKRQITKQTATAWISCFLEHKGQHSLACAAKLEDKTTAMFV